MEGKGGALMMRLIDAKGLFFSALAGVNTGLVAYVKIVHK